MRAGALTEATRRTPPPLPNKTNPPLEEMSHKRDIGTSPPGQTYSSPLSTIEFQQGKSSAPSKKIDWVVKQCCVRCNSHANSTYQGTKTHRWHGPAAIFPDIPLHPSASALMVPFGGRLGAPPLASDGDKRNVLAHICSENKWCTPAEGSEIPHHKHTQSNGITGIPQRIQGVFLQLTPPGNS